MAVAFITFALVSALVIPRSRPDFPSTRRGLATFLAATALLFVGMLAAVELFAVETEEAGAEAEHVETSASTEAVPTSPGNPTTVRVSEVDFRIRLPNRTLRAGSYDFVVSNDGKSPHNLVVKGPGVHDASTPTIAP